MKLYRKHMIHGPISSSDEDILVGLQYSHVRQVSPFVCHSTFLACR